MKRAVLSITLSLLLLSFFRFLTPAPIVRAQPITLTVSGVGASDKTYDGSATAALDTGGASLDGVDFDNCPNVYLDASGASGTFVDGSGSPTAEVGTWTVNVTGLALGGTDAGCYSFDPTAAAMASIHAAPLTITADNATKAYGDPLPTFSVSYAGFVNGETASVLDGSLGFDTSATAASPIGDYAVTPNGLTSTHYDISFVEGRLHVVAADTSTTLASSANPSTYASSVTLTAAVTSGGAAVTSGSVEFQDNTVTIGGCGNQVLGGNGQATCTISTLAPGTHAIRTTTPARPAY